MHIAPLTRVIKLFKKDILFIRHSYDKIRKKNKILVYINTISSCHIVN
jgi:hypothetical protein